MNENAWTHKNAHEHTSAATYNKILQRLGSFLDIPADSEEAGSSLHYCLMEEIICVKLILINHF